MAYLVHSIRGDGEKVAILVGEDVEQWSEDDRAVGYTVTIIDIGDQHDRLLIGFPCDRELVPQS